MRIKITQDITLPHSTIGMTGETIKAGAFGLVDEYDGTVSIAEKFTENIPDHPHVQETGHVKYENHFLQDPNVIGKFEVIGEVPQYIFDTQLRLRNEKIRDVLYHFRFNHLPPRLQPISRQCAELAYAMADGVPENEELYTGLRKLLEAKDCFVRAGIRYVPEPRPYIVRAKGGHFPKATSHWPIDMPDTLLVSMEGHDKVWIMADESGLITTMVEGKELSLKPFRVVTPDEKARDGKGRTWDEVATALHDKMIEDGMQVPPIVTIFESKKDNCLICAVGSNKALSTIIE